MGYLTQRADPLLTDFTECSLCKSCDKLKLLRHLKSVVRGDYRLDGGGVLFLTDDLGVEEPLRFLLGYFASQGCVISDHGLLVPALGFYQSSKPKAITNCQPLVERYISLVNPEVVVLLGAKVAKAVAGQRAALPVTVYGRPIKLSDRIYFPLPSILGIGPTESGQYNLEVILDPLTAFAKYYRRLRCG